MISDDSQSPAAACETTAEAPGPKHGGPGGPSPWVVRFAPLVPAGAPVLDLACGSGRHSRLFLEHGHPVLAVDRDLSRLSGLRDDPRLEALACDLEAGPIPDFFQRHFGGIVVTNYLHRPLFAAMAAALAPGGVLIYETFAKGNERFGKPSNPDFLLDPGELLAAFAERLKIVAFEDVTVEEPRPAAVQRLCAQSPGEGAPAAG